MMRMNTIQIRPNVKRVDLIETLKKNLAEHADIVQEAREGYVKKAKIALEKRLEEIRQGKVVALSFTLSPPLDYSEVYKSAIDMLTWHTAEMVELSPQNFNQLVRNQWDWNDNFLTANSFYSTKALSWLNDVQGGAIVAPPDDSPISSMRPE